MAVKLQAATGLTVSHDDLAAILTEHFCGSSYDAFAGLQVSNIVESDIANEFALTLTPKPAKPEPETK